MANAVPEDFVPGLEGVVAFTTDIAEPDKNGGNLRYRGVDIEDLVENKVTFADVWALLVDGRFGNGLPPAEPFPLPIHTGDVRVDAQAALAMLAPIWGYEPLLDIDDATAQNLARASVMALSYVAQSARGIHQPAVPQRVIDECTTVTERFMTRWKGDPIQARRGHRRLLGERRRTRYERLDLHRARHRLDRRRRGGMPVRRDRRDVGSAARRRPGRVLPMIEEVEKTGDARGLVKGILDRKEKLMGFGHRVYRAEDPRARVLRRTAQTGRAPLQGGRRSRAGHADRAA